jgi:hypothetical protein
MCLELKHVNPDLILYMGMHIYLYHYNAVHTNLQAPQPIALITQNQSVSATLKLPPPTQGLSKSDVCDSTYDTGGISSIIDTVREQITCFLKPVSDYVRGLINCHMWD